MMGKNGNNFGIKIKYDNIPIVDVEGITLDKLDELVKLVKKKVG
jgi:hypothetical protein